MKRIYIAAIVCALNWTGSGRAVPLSLPSGSAFRAASPVERAYKQKQRDVQVEDEGVVSRVLADDVEGDRHQRFIVRLASGLTVLIAHNIDIAPRVAALQKDDKVRFYGEYIWTEQGGVVHWTHHDPKGRHVAGWIKHKGKIYQ